MNKKRIIGFFFIGFSILIAFFNFTITGAVIGTLISNFVSVITIGLFIGGVFLLLESSELEKIVTTDGRIVTMSKDAKKKFEIYRSEMLSAIGKIGVKIGKEKKMKHYDFYTIRKGEKARLLFNRSISGTVEVIDYLTDHDYNKWMKTHGEYHKTQSKPREYAYAH